MDDILEMAEASDERSEDTDAAVVPDYFVVLRRWVCREDGSARLLFRHSALLSLVAWSIFTTVILGFMLPTMDGREGVVTLTLGAMGFSFVFTLPGLFAGLLHQAIRPEGPLTLLGVGNKCVATRQLQPLPRWRALLSMAAVLTALFVVVGPVGGWWLPHILWAASGDDWTENFEYKKGHGMNTPPPAGFGIVMALFPIVFLNMALGFASAAAWYFSLKVAVVLAHDDVSKVVKQTTAETLKNDTLWTERVAGPAISLATQTMKHLSDGWGTGTALAFLVPWVISLTNFTIMIHNVSMAQADYNPLRHGLTCFGMALVPLIVAKDVAGVSSLCDELLNTINDLRLEWKSSEAAQVIHNRTFPLRTTLKDMHGGQGLGFVILTRVIDRKSLNLIFITMGSFFSTAIPILFALLPDPTAVRAAASGGSGGTGCNTTLNAAAEDLLRVAVSMYEGSGCIP